MTDAEERQWRLTTACAMARVSKADVAAEIGVTGGALSHWQRTGDRAQRFALTAAVIARAISALGGVVCPPEALQPGSPFKPEWIKKE